jgi:2'-5' RNA ligase
MPESGGLRLFFALWPDDEVRARIAREATTAVADSGGRLIPPDNLHVTLLFLGHTPHSRLAQATAAAARVRCRGLRIAFDQIEVWARSHIVALTSSAPPVEAGELAASLRAQLAGLAPDEEREFRPHVTLARDARRRSASRAIEPVEWKAREFVLVESNMTRTGSTYAVRERWPLAG